jgi:hypothetical protein
VKVIEPNSVAVKGVIAAAGIIELQWSDRLMKGSRTAPTVSVPCCEGMHKVAETLSSIGSCVI